MIVLCFACRSDDSNNCLSDCDNDSENCKSFVHNNSFLIMAQNKRCCLPKSGNVKNNHYFFAMPLFGKDDGYICSKILINNGKELFQ